VSRSVSSTIWRSSSFPLARRSRCSDRMVRAPAMQLAFRKCWVFCRRGGLQTLRLPRMGALFSAAALASQRSCANGP
jgi:hypothetical protein